MFKKILFLLLFVVISTIVIAQQSQTAPWAQEPDGFKSVKFGTSEKETKKILDIPGMFSTRLAFQTNVRNVWDCVGKKKEVKLCTTEFVKIGDLKPVVEIMFSKDKFVGAVLRFSADEYNTYREAFISKYGQPHGTRVDDVKNLMGASLQSDVLIWDGPHVHIEIAKFGTSMKESSASIAQQAFLGLLQAVDKEKANKAADDM